MDAIGGSALTDRSIDVPEAGGQGLPSYPHPRLMPGFWEYPTVSMGLGPLNALYQARFLKYLHHRGIADTSDRKVWCFLGDGETDEPESLGAISLAGREKLDNLIFVVNCNLQRLDGPVRGNGKIIQELEGVFRGAGWRVIKVIWGSYWDKLFAKDKDGLLRQRMEEAVDGDYQNYKARSGAYTREHFFGKYPETREMVADMTDPDTPAWLLAETRARGQQVDFLVNNAGSEGPDLIRTRSWPRNDAYLRLMMTSVAAMCHEFIPGMVERGFGRIVYTSSVSGLVAEPTGSAYNSSKAGLLGLMRSVALDAGPFGVTANAVLPGWVRTEMADRSADQEAKERGITPDQVWEERAALYPAGRVPTMQEVAEAIAFLASEE